MTTKYLRISDMYSTGPVSHVENMRRVKQGMPAQIVASHCAGCGNVNKDRDCIYCNLPLYPEPVVQYNYGSQQIPNTCQCVQYMFRY